MCSTFGLKVLVAVGHSGVYQTDPDSSNLGKVYLRNLSGYAMLSSLDCQKCFGRKGGNGRCSKPEGDASIAKKARHTHYNWNLALQAIGENASSASGSMSTRGVEC